MKFQGGGFQHWGQAGFENCAALLNMEFERVLYKNNYAAGVTIFNIYMVRLSSSVSYLLENESLKRV